MPSPSGISILRCLATFGLLAASSAWAQAPDERAEDEAVGSSVNYVFATDLGSGVYDLDGRTLQIYKLTYEKELREPTPEQLGVRFDLPVTFGFFDFKPTDVLSSGLPTRVDSFSVVPGIELDYLMEGGWHLIPYARAGFSVASSSVDGWLYGAGLRVERKTDFHGWDKTPPQYRDGTTIPDRADWRQRVQVSYVQPLNALQTSASDTGAKRIYVFIEKNGQILAQQYAIRTDVD